MTRRRRVARVLDWFANLISGPSVEAWAQVTQADVDAGIERWARESSAQATPTQRGTA